MVNTNVHIKHPLAHGGTARNYWVIYQLNRLFTSLALIVLIGASTPWNQQNAETSILFISYACALVLLQKFVGAYIAKQVHFHTPGYLGRFKIDEPVKAHSPVIDELMAAAISLITLVVFYLFNPQNENYSTLALTLGWFYTITSLLDLGRTTYTLSVLGQISDRQNWGYFISPLVWLIVVAPVYKSFPHFTGISADTNLVATFLMLWFISYLVTWVLRKFFVPAR